MTQEMNTSKGTRWIGVMFLVGAVLMAITAFRLEQPLCMLSAVLQLIAWFFFVTRANQLERMEQAARQPVELPARQGTEPSAPARRT